LKRVLALVAGAFGVRALLRRRARTAAPPVDDLRAKLAETALDIVRRDGDLDVQARRVEHRYRELAATIRPRVLSVSGLFSTWKSYRRFRKGGTEMDAQRWPVTSA